MRKVDVVTVGDGMLDNYIFLAFVVQEIRVGKGRDVATLMQWSCRWFVGGKFKLLAARYYGRRSGELTIYFG